MYIFGLHLDDILSFYSAKFVQIRHSRLGILYYSQLIGVFMYIFVYLVFYRGRHLQANPIVGNANLRIQHPTNHCNPLHPDCKATWTSLSKLPYCDVYKPGPHDPEPAPRQLECTVRDNINISVIGHAPGVLFLPTRLSHFEQKLSCVPSEENDYWCENLYSFDPESKETSYFLAEAERFTLLVDHSFQSENTVTGALIEDGDAADFAGSIETDGDLRWRKHDKRWAGKGLLKPFPVKGLPVADCHRHTIMRPIPTLEDKKLEDFPSVLMISIGDVISIADLLKLADPAGAKLMDTNIGHRKHTMRWSGAVLIITVDYSNLVPWDPLARSKTKYVLSAEILSSEEYKKMMGTPSKQGRMIHDVHGFLIIAKVQGQVHTFEFQALLVVLTTAMALVAIAKFTTDTVMVYCLRFNAKYSILKYQKSQRFSNLITIFRGIEGNARASNDNYALLQNHHEEAHEKILHEWIRNSQCLPSGQDLLTVIAKMEQRLNRLDGNGAEDIWSSGSPMLTQFVEKVERHHWAANHSIPVSSWDAGALELCGSGPSAVPVGTDDEELWTNTRDRSRKQTLRD